MAETSEQQTDPGKQLFIARQPIFDHKKKVYGYEILFRDSKRNIASVFDGDRATSQVITDTFLEIGLDKLVGKKYAFFNLTRNFLINDAEFPLSSAHVGLEILETVTVDEKLLDSVERLAEQGFRIALDDFVMNEGTKQLLPHAHMVKLDVLDKSEEDLRKQLSQIRQYPVQLVAERVETQEAFNMAMDLGFDYFQGFFLCEPEVIHRQRLPDNKLSILRLLARLQDPDVGPKELEQIIKQDVTLSYKLLRCVNSAYYGLSLEVSSIHHAIVYLGLPAVRNWVRLLVLAGLQDRPPELIRIALTRAKMCEVLSEHAPNLSREMAFTVGLFSVLDALMNMPMEQILERVPLSEEVDRALVDGKGAYGVLLGFVKAYERGDWETIESGPYPADAVKQAYLDALESAEREQP
ncbi:EAL and modified HD-GYP domain-containing signal transduction protein [Natronospira proteinivora]|uniref:EAL and modified HD-GYP domain-containing signal transduction protein n=1 Tax=Natronospira proteinivora TaxID=1807133 RepID=A0ABT1G533_9GAMM|nr:HDOD domain-containing protein [Natronospira proteinivora]MCP1726409.1 EAL and modified HD-GYP domain-containing signal transduction protein [Natronospira proteinivora]